MARSYSGSSYAPARSWRSITSITSGGSCARNLSCSSAHWSMLASVELSARMTIPVGAREHMLLREHPCACRKIALSVCPGCSASISCFTRAREYQIVPALTRAPERGGMTIVLFATDCLLGRSGTRTPTHGTDGVQLTAGQNCVMHGRACFLVALSAIAEATAVTAKQASSATAVVSPSKVRRISAIWGHGLTFLPTWAPSGVEPSHWWSETCACATDDSLLVVQFRRQKTRLDWEVSDQRESDRVRAGVVCHGTKFAAGAINSRAIFYRRATATAWTCLQIPAGARWYPSDGKPIIAPLGKLIISVRQLAGRTGRLKAAELERMVASAQRSSLLGRTSLSRFELPSHGEVRRLVLAFRRRLFLPTRLPGGFI